MTGLSSCSSPSRSEAGWLLALALLLGAAAAGAESPGCPGCGTVSGSVGVWQTSIRTDGPKDDRDVVLYLEPAEDGELEAASAKATMDQKNLVFVPHVLAVQKGTTVTFLNNDPDDHNVYFLDDETGDTLDIGTWGPGISVDHQFTKAGTMITLCKLHLEMAAYVVVVDGPWFTTVKLDPETQAAVFEIGGVPAGSYRLVAWHKKLKQKGGAAEVDVRAGDTSEVEVVITKAKYARSPD